MQPYITVGFGIAVSSLNKEQQNKLKALYHNDILELVGLDSYSIECNDWFECETFLFEEELLSEGALRYINGFIFHDKSVSCPSFHASHTELKDIVNKETLYKIKEILNFVPIDKWQYLIAVYEC